MRLGQTLVILLYSVAIIMLTTHLHATTLSEKPALQKGLEALERLENALKTEEISRAEYIEQIGYFLYCAEKIDPRFAPEAGCVIKCGTFMAREFHQNFHLLSKSLQDFFAGYSNVGNGQPDAI